MDGVEQWLNDNAENGKVNTADLMAYIRDSGQVRFEEVNIAGRDFYESERSRYGAMMAKGEISSKEYTKLVNDLDARTGETQYGNYVLPNGENYREVVLAMPVEGNMLEARKIGDSWVVVDAKTGKKWEQEFRTEWPIPEEGSGKKQREKAMRMAESQKRTLPENLYTSSHFNDIPNYVAHMRLNERTDSEGNKGLFIEEIQSDRHQQGREKGYKGEPS